MKLGEVWCHLEIVWNNIKNSYEFLKFFDSFDMFITYHYVLLEVYFIYMHTHKNSRNFGIVPETRTLFLCFHLLTKSTTSTPTVMSKSLFAQNILGLTLVLSMVFIADFFSLALFWKVSEYWSQAILSQTLSYCKKCWN